MQVRNTLLTIFLPLAVTTACNRLEFKDSSDSRNRNGSDQSAIETSEDSKQNSNRPTDKPEGVEGYLTDPNLVAVTDRVNGGQDIVGTEGAVAVTSGKITDLVIGIWSVDHGSIDASKFSSGNLKVPGVNVGCTAPNEDGSFSASVSSLGSSLLITVDTPCQSKVVEISAADSGKSKAFIRAKEGPFLDVFSSYSTSCMCPSGMVYYEATDECLVPFDDCPPDIYPAGPVCGCNGKSYASVCDAKTSGLINYVEGSCK